MAILKSLKTSEAAEILNLREHEVRALGDEGKIKSYRTEGNHRRYCYESVNAYKNRVLEIDYREVVAYLPYDKEKECKERMLKLCEMLGWKYILLQEKNTECFEDSELKKLIEMIKENKIERVLIDSLDTIDGTKLNFIKEVSNYHNVQVIALSEIQKELWKDVK